MKNVAKYKMSKCLFIFIFYVMLDNYCYFIYERMLSFTILNIKNLYKKIINV